METPFTSSVTAEGEKSENWSLLSGVLLRPVSANTGAIWRTVSANTGAETPAGAGWGV